MRPVYIYDTVRTPRGRGHAEKGSLRNVRPVDLLKILLDAVQSRNSLDTALVEEIVLGCNTAIGEQGANIAKIASLYAGWHHGANGVTVSSFCTSGLEAVQMAAMKVMTGSANCAVAGGVESMSRIPIFSDKGSWFSDKDVSQKTGFIHMGLSADIIANLEGFMASDLNDFSIRSHRLANAAWESQEYRKQVIPVTVKGKTLLVRDELFRSGLTPAKMASLPKVFTNEKDGKAIPFILKKFDALEDFEFRHSVGNAPGIADAASLLLIGNRSLGTKLGIKPIARIIGFASVSDDPVLMLTGVVDATKKVLKKNKLKVSDIDLFEVNESFASVPMKFMKDLKVAPESVNINGGAISLGHPLGATGGILIGCLIHNLKERGMKRGIATICGGAGIAQATLIEVM